MFKSKMINSSAMYDDKLDDKAVRFHYQVQNLSENKIYTIDDFKKEFDLGIDAIRNRVKTLMQNNYLHIARLQDDSGRIEKVVYISTMESVKLSKEDRIKYIENHNYRKSHWMNTEKICNKPTLSTYAKTPYMVNSLYKETHALLLCINNIYNNNITNVILYYYIINYITETGSLPELFSSISHKKTESDAIKIKNNISYKKNRMVVSYDFTKEIAIIDFWNSQNDLRTHKTNTKTYEKIKSALRRELRYSSPMVIKQAIENYNWLQSLEYSVLRGTKSPYKVGLDEFFGFNSFHNQLRNKQYHPLQNIKNWFFECRQGKDYLTQSYSMIKKDHNPEYTYEIIEQLRNHNLFEIDEIEDIKPKDKNIIIKSAEKMRDFINTHDFNISNNAIEKTALHLAEYLRDRTRDPHIGYLISDITWKNIEKIMENKNMLSQNDNRLQIINGVEYYDGIEVMSDDEKNSLENEAIEPDWYLDIDPFTLEQTRIYTNKEAVN